MTPELHRPFAPEAIPPGGETVVVEADDAECAALAARMRLPAIERFSCRFRLVAGFGGTIDAEGHLRARIVQTCVVSLDDFTAELSERFALRFVPRGRETFDADPEAVDEIPYAPGSIDLGEAAAEQLALALDPYPRRPGVALPALGHEGGGHEGGGDEGQEPSASPAAFAALAALKFTGRSD